MCTERVLLLVAALGLGCTAPRPTGAVSGRVTIDGEALHAGVVVSVVSGAVQVGTVTDDEGRFEATGLPDGVASLTFGATDTVEGTRRLTAPVGSEGLEVVFHPAGRIQGSVVSATTKEPVRDALVVSARGTAAANTGRDGQFRLSAVPAGAGTVVVSAPGFAPVELKVTVRRGEPLDVGVVPLGPASTGSGPAALEGRVVFTDQTVAAGATVRLRGPAGLRETTADVRGAFRFDALPPGAVELVASLPGFETTVPNVLALQGSSGLIIADGLTPLSESPIPLMPGRRVGSLIGALTPDEGAVVGFEDWPKPAFTLAPLDGGAPVELVSAAEFGLTATALIVAMTADSRAIALSAGFDSSDPKQFFLVSTGSQGRQLLAERACLVGVHDDVLYFVEGGRCPASGPLKRVPLRFGATASTVGQVGQNPFLDLPYHRLFDRSYPTAAPQVFDVDLVEWGTTPGRRRVLSGVRSLESLSPDGSQLVYLAAGDVRLYEVSTGLDRRLLSGVEAVERLWWTSAGGVVLSTRSPSQQREVHVASPGSAARRVGGESSVAGPSPDGAWVALSASSGFSSLVTLSVAPFSAGPTQQLGTDVGRHQWTPSGELLFIADVDRGSRAGRVMRWRPGGAVEELGTGADGDSLVVSDDGLRAAFVRRLGQGRDQIVIVHLPSGTVVEGPDTALSDSPWFYYDAFSPDGRWFAHVDASRSFLQSTTSRRLIPLSKGTGITWLRGGAVMLQVSRLEAPWKALEGTYLAKPE